VSFAVAAEAYDRFMGRYSTPLAPRFLDFAKVGSGPVLDVGCGPGALTSVLVERFGADGVAAADPSEPFVAAARERHPGVRVELAPAEAMPFEDGQFAASLAQLVVHFMSDPVAGIREMTRVTREGGGVVAACVWDLAGGRAPLGPFWKAARQLDPDVDDESRLAGAREGHLAELLEVAGVREIADGAISVSIEHATFDGWWEPYTLGVGPAGTHVARLDEAQRATLRDRCRDLLPDAPFTIEARAWAARGVV
jgi:SAM-dependent methyltransferase